MNLRQTFQIHPVFLPFNWYFHFQFGSQLPGEWPNSGPHGESPMNAANDDVSTGIDHLSAIPESQRLPCALAM
jgi:hypothetical protein